MIQPAAMLGEALASRPDARSLEIQRVFTVRPEVLWDMFTMPAHFSRWWGGGKARCTKCEIDLRVGGAWAAAMEFPDGDVAEVAGEYLEIEPKSRLRFTWRWTHMAGGSPDSVVTLTFAARGEGSLLTLLHRDLPEEKVDQHEKGWLSALESLARAADAGEED